MRRRCREFPRDTSGQEAVEFALLWGAVVLPLTFALIFVAEMLWVWHSVADFTRDGARYAATHCWQAGGSNVSNYMQQHVPRMIDMDQFISGAAGIEVSYFARDPESGGLSEFGCDAGECSVGCVPDTVTVRITNYQFTRFVGYLGLPPVPLPDLHTSMPVTSAGCDEAGACLP